MKGIFKHRTKPGLYIVLDVVTNKTDDTQMILYTKNVGITDKQEMFVRTLDDFNAKFTRFGSERETSNANV